MLSDDELEVLRKDLGESRQAFHLYWGAELANATDGYARWTGKDWYYFNGRYWDKAVGDARVMNEAQALMLGALNDREVTTLTHSMMKSIIEQAKSHLHFDPREWDRARPYINLANGIYKFNADPGQKRFYKHRPQANMTRITVGSYVEDDDLEDWEKFLDGMPTMQDPETRAYLQKVFGLVLNGQHKEEIFPILLGPGNTGRSRLVDALHTALGDYAHTGATTLLKVGKNDRHPTEVFALKGKRLVRVDELGKGVRYDDGKLKMLTGGDRVNGRGVYKDDSDFEPTHTFLLTTNHAPMLPLHDSALERRVRVIPFDVLESPDKSYSERVKEQAFSDAVITWAIRGWELYQEEGLDAPQAISDATARMWRDANVVARFIDEGCEYVSRLKDASTTQELFRTFESWALATGQRERLSERAFGAELTRLGHPSEGNRRARKGLKATFKEDADEAE